MKVSELAQRVDVSTDTIRHYVRIGLLEPGIDPDNQYKQFSSQDEKRLRFILKAKSLGFSLQDIQAILDQADKGQSPCPQVRTIMQKRLLEAEKQLQQMQQNYQQMQQAVQRWQTQPDCEPTSEHICHLIEGRGDCCHE